MLEQPGPVGMTTRLSIPRNTLLDLGFAAGGYLLVNFLMRLLELPLAGPAAVLAALAVATRRLRVNGESWSLIGVARPKSPARLPLAVLALYIATVACTLVIVEPLARSLGWAALDLSAYAGLRGSPVEVAKLLLIAWTTAAIGEELLFRGFLLTRLEALLGNRRASSVLAVLLQAATFAVAHAYLGPEGVATAFAVGVIYGAWYVLRGRNLWPLIIAHGLTDTVSLLAIYAGLLV